MMCLVVIDAKEKRVGISGVMGEVAEMRRGQTHEESGEEPHGGCLKERGPGRGQVCTPEVGMRNRMGDSVAGAESGCCATGGRQGKTQDPGAIFLLGFGAREPLLPGEGIQTKRIRFCCSSAVGGHWGLCLVGKARDLGSQWLQRPLGVLLWAMRDWS